MSPGSVSRKRSRGSTVAVTVAPMNCSDNLEAGSALVESPTGNSDLEGASPSGSDSDAVSSLDEPWFGIGNETHFGVSGRALGAATEVHPGTNSMPQHQHFHDVEQGSLAAGVAQVFAGSAAAYQHAGAATEVTILSGTPF